jgi:hypothetical protein
MSAPARRHIVAAIARIAPGWLLWGPVQFACAAADLLGQGDRTMTSNDPSVGATPAGAALLRSASDMVRYAAGNPEFRGRTTVEVRGDRSVEASFQRGKDHKTYRATLSAAEFDALRRQLAEHDPRSLRPGRELAQPDEPQVEMTVVEGAQRVETRAWYGEQWTNPRLRGLIVAFTDLAARVSRGKIPF